MEKYNNILKNITELIEKGLLGSKDLKKEAEKALKFRVENIAKKMNLISREEFEVQKKIIEKLQKEIKDIKFKRKKNSFKKKSKR